MATPIRTGWSAKWGYCLDEHDSEQPSRNRGSVRKVAWCDESAPSVAGFNGGEGTLAASRPRDSIPLENFLIGNTCFETAQNFVSTSTRPSNSTTNQWVSMRVRHQRLRTSTHTSLMTVMLAFYRPSGYDREFIAFHDIHASSERCRNSALVNRFVSDESPDTKALDKFAGHNGGALTSRYSD